MQQRTCGECGAVTEEGEDFCGQCGAYLEWEEHPPAEPAPAADQVAEQPEPPAERGLADRVKAAVGLGPVEGPPDPAPTPVAPEAPAAPVSTTAGRDPAPVQPGVAAPRHRPAPAPRREQVQPGDLVCGECGAGNRPDRKYCRRCGHDLAEAVVATVPWWRRILPRRQRTMVAGTRPDQPSGRGLPGRLVAALIVLALVAAGGYLARGYVRGAYEAVLDRVKDVKEVVPADARGPAGRPGHGPDNTWDGDPGVYWSPTGDGDGARLVFPFKRPVRVVYIKILPGASDTAKSAWRAVGRPREVELVMTSSDGTKREETLELENAMGDVDFNIATSDVTSVELTVVSSYEGSEGSGTALAEVEFYARR